MNINSRITGKSYKPDECVFIINTLQVHRYLDNGAELLDVIPGNDRKLAFVFNRVGTYSLYDRWCKREL